MGTLKEYKGLFTNFFNLCPFDYMAVVGRGKVGSVNRLTTPIGY